MLRNFLQRFDISGEGKFKMGWTCDCKGAIHGPTKNVFYDEMISMLWSIYVQILMKIRDKIFFL